MTDHTTDTAGAAAGPLTLTGGAVWDGTDFIDADVIVRDGRIAAIGTGLAAEGDVLDATGCLILPGLVDVHVHLREPGGEDAETVASGAAAAVAGGFVDVVAMGNTNPPHDSLAVVRHVAEAGRAAGLARVHPAGCVTRGRAGKDLADLAELHAYGVRVFTDDGDPVADARLMRRALEYVGTFGGVVADHCEEKALTVGAQMNEGEVSGRLGLTGWPSVAEEIIVARDILLADYTGARVHLQHVSTAGSVELVRQAKARGVNVTAEVTPHHLTLTDELAASFDPVYKVNPPIRGAADRAAVRAALADGTIDCVATDHAPHPPERKEEWTQAACGMLGLETALPLVHALVLDGELDWARLIDAMATAPARVADLAPRGRLAEGVTADLCVFDPAAEWEVDPALLHSKAANTPYRGMHLTGRVRHTIVGGHVAYCDGEIRTRTSASSGPMSAAEGAAQ